MDLRNNQITVAELLDNPKSRAVFEKRFAKVMSHPLLSAARTLTLGQLVDLAQVYLPKGVIQETLQELKVL